MNQSSPRLIKKCQGNYDHKKYQSKQRFNREIHNIRTSKMFQSVETVEIYQKY